MVSQGRERGACCLTQVTNRIGFIELDRPQALNALSTTMIRLMQSALDTFFIEEYRLNHAIFSYPKPYIALVNGVVMGGGMGISQGAHRTGGLRVVGGTTRMAMPATRIGFFPDVGMGWFLARTRGALGRYLAVTGETIDTDSALYAGFADVFIDESAWPALLDALLSTSFATGGEIAERIRAASASSEEVQRGTARCPLRAHGSISTFRGPGWRRFSRRWKACNTTRRMRKAIGSSRSWGYCASARRCRWRWRSKRCVHPLRALPD